MKLATFYQEEEENEEMAEKVLMDALAKQPEN